MFSRLIVYLIVIVFSINGYSQQINCFDSTNKKGDFDYSNTTGNDFTDYWSKSSTGTFAIENRHHFYGSGALRVDVADNNRNSVTLTTTNNCSIDVDNNDTWNISMYVMGEVGDQLAFSLIDSNGSSVGSTTHTIRYKGFHYVRVKFNTTANSDTSRLKINFHHSGTYFIDRLVLTEGDFKNWYVSPSGSGDGLSSSSTKNSVSAVISDNDFNNGDIINVMAGTYQNSNYQTHTAASGSRNRWNNDWWLKLNTNSVFNDNTRTIDRPLVIRNYVNPANGNHDEPLIQFDGKGGIVIGSQSNRVSFIEIAGLKIQGPNDMIDFTRAKANRTSAVTRKSNGTTGVENQFYHGRGIALWGGTYINMHNNEVWDTPNSGIRANNADYIRIANNKVYETTLWSYNAESGIVIAQSLNHGATANGSNPVNQNTSGEIKMRIEGNITYGNVNRIVYFNTSYGCVTNGGYDTSKNTYGCGGEDIIKDGSGCYITRNNYIANGTAADNNPNGLDYHGTFYFANNVSWGNGMNGLVVHKTDNAIAVNNTIYKNGEVPSDDEDAWDSGAGGSRNYGVDWKDDLGEPRQKYGGLVVHSSSNVKIHNNISWPKESGDKAFVKFTQNGLSSNNVTWAGNLAGPDGIIKSNSISESISQGNPSFNVSGSYDTANDFKLQSSSNAKNTGHSDSDTKPFNDNDFNKRETVDSSIDKGAFEFGSSTSSGGTLPNTPTDIALSSTSIAENSNGGTKVGDLSTTDADGGSHTYSLVSGSGDTDNASFEISGTELKTKSSTSLDYETKNSYSIRLKTTDPTESALTFEKPFTISITDVDEVAPTLSNVSIVSNNSINTLAKAGDEITLTFTASESISTPTVTFKSGEGFIASGSVSYNNATGDLWTASYTVSGADNNGSVTYSIAFSDSAGNAGNPVTSGSGSVTVDTTRPSMTITASEVSDGATSDDATLSLTFTSNENTSDFAQADVSVSGGTLSSFNGSGATYTATFTPTSNGAPTTIDVEANKFKDSSGNNNTAASQFNWTHSSFPKANPQTVSVTEDVSKTISLTGNGVPGDTNISFIIMDVPSNGTLKNNGNLISNNGTTLSSADVVYTANSETATSDKFEIRTKTDAGLLSGIVDVTLNITLVNDKPVATAQTVEAVEQTAKTITLAGTDAEGDTLTYSIVSNPSNGTVTLDGATATYTSNSDTATSDSFTFKVNDGTIDSDPATVTINITNVIPDLSDISLDKSTVEESGKVVLTATISEVDLSDITIPFTYSGTATMEVDYSTQSTSLVIPAGQTSASLDINIIEDNSDEDDETVILTPGTVTNANNSNTDAITFTITDDDDPPTITFTKSAESIVENSSTDLTIDVIPSVPSGKDIEIPYTLSGTAESSEYTVSDSPLKISAGSLNGKISISTNGKDDNDVEPKETIVLTYGSIVNASTSTTESSIILLSDDKPTITVSSDKDEFYEHEKAVITATLNAEHSYDVNVTFDLSGTATFNEDYSIDFENKGNVTTVAGGNGDGNALNQFKSENNLYEHRGINDVHVDNNGNIYSTDSGNYRVMKWVPGADEGSVIISIGPNNPGTEEDRNISSIYVDSSGNIYVAESFNHRVTKWAPGANEGVVVAGGNGNGSSLNQLNSPRGVFVDSQANIYVADSNNNRIVKWDAGASEGTIVAGGNGAGGALNQLNNPHKINVHSSGDIYIADTERNRIVKWAPGANEGVVVAGGDINEGGFGTGNNDDLTKLDLPRGLFVTEDRRIYISELGNNRITLWKDGDKKGALISKGKDDSKFNKPSSVFMDNLSNIYVGDMANSRVEKITYYPELKINAGELTTTFEIQGVEELDYNDEGNEEIVITPNSNNSNISGSKTVIIKDNVVEFVKKDEPFINLSKSSISWGDYDRDGDMDLAIMGQSNAVGAVTAIYENKEGTFEDTNQNFTKVYDGDLSWVDLNKDGWLDLVVTGYNETAKTNIYINNEGQTFETSTADWGIPNAYASKMSWGDLDNDGDIDLALVGIDDQENGFSYLYLRVDGQDKFIVQDLSYFSGGGFKYGDLEIADFDQDSDNDLIFTGERVNSELRAQIKLNSFISPDDPKYENLPLKYSRDIEENIPYALKNASISTYFNQNNKELSYIINGRDSNDDLKTLIRSVGGVDRESNTPKVALENGDVAVGDINNDGANDFMYTGEDASGSPVTKLFFTTSCDPSLAGAVPDYSNCNIVESSYNFVGLRESTVEFVDYDTDGDLDIFITGLSDSGAETILYQVNFPQKVNTAPTEVLNLSVTDLGYGNLRFDWDKSTDDFSNAIGYNIKIGTTPGGSEFSNTLSNLETGSRLISAPPPILTNQFKTNLFPGIYYIAAQSIDPGVKASSFSDEIKLELFYKWKLLNQGGIVDRYIEGKPNPVLRLADLDGDDDLDLLYGSESYNLDDRTKYAIEGHKYDSEEKRMIRFDRERKTENSLANLIINDVTDIQVGLINNDEYPDVVVNRYTTNPQNNETKNDLFIHFGKAPVDGGSSNLNEETLIYDQVRLGDGLFEGKVKLADLNNDGQLEILQIGLTNENITSGTPKLIIHSYNNDSNSFDQNDVSDQIAALSNSSFDLGDVDNDQDLDFVITGFDQSSGLKSYLYENTSDTGGEFKLEVTDNNFAATRDGSIDFFDYDTDGDLDILITGTGVSGDIFEIYVNKLNEDITDWPKLNTLDIPGLRNSKIDYGDFNGDGYSDLLYSGVQSGLGKISELREYYPTLNKYVKSSFDIGEIVDADVEFGDIDGDGDLDFVLSGTNKENDNYHTISTFLNVRSESAEFQTSIKPLDDDIRESFTLNSQNQNLTYVKNNPPSAPTINSAKVLTDQSSIQGKLPVELSWNSSSDDLTLSTGLSYSIRVGTTPGGSEIMTPNASDSGIRSIPSKGNAEYNLKWKIALAPGKYYWSVQAVDASFIGSAFSEEIELIVYDDDILLKIDSDGDGVYDSQDQCPNTPTGSKVDVNGCKIFELPVNNYKVEVASATCIGNSDGVIDLSVEDASFDYTVTITGKDNVTITGTNKTGSVTGLAKGTYEVCFTVDGQAKYEQCFEVEVGEPPALTAYIDVDNDNKKTSITMGGSNIYNVTINGVKQRVTGNTFEANLSTGLSIIRVDTDLECQGFVEKEVFISEEIHYYPNPTEDDVKVHVGGEDTRVKVSVFSEKGDLIYTRYQDIADISRKTNIDLSNQITGTYIVILESKTVRQTFKIIRE